MNAKSRWGFSESVFLEPSNSDFRKLDPSIEVRSWRVEWNRPERQRGPGGKAAGRGGHASPPPATDHRCPETRITRMQPQDATSDRLSAVIVRLSTEKLYLITRVMQWAFLCVFFFFLKEKSSTLSKEGLSQTKREALPRIEAGGRPAKNVKFDDAKVD